MAAVSIVNGNVWVNMWATAYALPVWRRTHGGHSCVLSLRVQKWIYYLSIYLVSGLSAGILTTLLAL